MLYAPTKNLSGKKTALESIHELFDDLHRKWREGMDITDYKKERRGDGVIVRMETFMDDELANIGARLVESGRSSINAVVLWLSCCDYYSYPDEVKIIARSQFYADRARDMFAGIIFDLLGKSVTFTHDIEVKRRVAA